MALTFELLDCIEFWARHRGESSAVSSTTRTISYSELLTNLNDLCCSLDPVDSTRIAVLASAKLATTIGVLGVLQCGCSAVILNPKLPPDLIKTFIEETTPGAVLVAQEDERAWKTVAERYESMAAMRRVQLSMTETTRSLARRQRPEPQLDREWAVLYSSGSTGERPTPS